MIEMKHINLSFRDKDLFTDQEIKIDFVGNDIILYDKDTTNRVTNGTLTIKK